MNFDLKVGFSIVDLLDMVIYNKCIIVYWGDVVYYLISLYFVLDLDIICMIVFLGLLRFMCVYFV